MSVHRFAAGTIPAERRRRHPFHLCPQSPLGPTRETHVGAAPPPRHGPAAQSRAMDGNRSVGPGQHLGWKTWLPELDVAPVEELSGCDFVLEVGSAGCTVKAAGAAALNDWVLATSVDL